VAIMALSGTSLGVADADETPLRERLREIAP
jgi:hypothetical protein